MPEQNLIINHKKITYHGIFRTDDFFNVLNAALAEKGYTKVEKKSEELVTPGGRLFQLELRPFKSVSQYVNLMLKIHLTFDNITETTMERHGFTQKFQQGDLLIFFDAWSITDYEGRWGTKPWTYFLKGVIHKYIYKFPLEGGYTSQLVSDTAYIYGQVKNLLQSYEGKKTAPITEKEVRKKMEEEMAENPL
ncbi:MAG: hypothetical protein AABX24_02355 [Nanoarchaeota archaeon]